MRSDEFSMTFIKSGLMIEKLNHMITAPRVHTFTLLGYHYILLGVTDGLWDSSGVILMIDDPRRIELELFQSIEKNYNDIMMEIIIYLTARYNRTYRVLEFGGTAEGLGV